MANSFTNLAQTGADPETPTLEQLRRFLDHAMQFTPDVEVYAGRGVSTSVNFEADRLKQVLARESVGIGIRLVKNGRVGISSTNDVEDVKGLVQRALEVSAFGPRAFFQLPGPAAFEHVDIYDPAVEGVSVEEMVELGRSAISQLKADNKDVQYEGGLSTARSADLLVNSKGLSISSSSTSTGFGLSGTWVRGTDMLFVGDRVSSCRPVQGISAVIAGIREQLEYARETVQAPTGHLPVVFTPRAVAGMLLGPLLSALNGRNVLQGTSPLVGRKGEMVFDRRFTITDEPLLAYRTGSRPFDDEGVASRRLPLVENGMVMNFFYDLQTAGEAGVESTGAASRGLDSMPSPSSSNLIIAAGEAAYRDLLASVKDGLLVERFIGAGQGNVLGGDASGNVLLGYRIQNGQVLGRVKDTMLHCNIYHVLDEHLGAVSTERMDVGGAFTSPWILCENVSVSGKG
jgi:PmbA protein